ncbi:MAG: glycosyltransferase family 4 protein, partial [Betaproteobacteria bacterium]
KLTARTLAEAGASPAKMVTVSLGAPAAIAREGLPARPPGTCRVLYAGALSVQKGAHILLEAWRSVRGAGRAELHLAGENLLPARLLSDLPENVHLHGNIPSRDLFAMYERSSVLAFPTLCDGFGMVVTEAFSRGLPVITTVNAGASDLVAEGRNGFLVPPADADALAERLQWCIDNPSALHDMREAALLTAEENSWAHFRDEFKRQLVARLRPC